ncbi:MAG TPA: hypothetical protein VN947_23750 [Polyangia bacterium]|nr:hypothetical protein [Polyangia bacterium]
MRAIFLAAALLAVGCGDDTTTNGGGSDMAVPADMTGGGDMTLLNHGCAPLTNPVTTPDGGAGGDTWANYAQGFFGMYCTRCHSSTLTGGDRNGAPDGYDWDDQATVNAHLAEIRDAVGVSNFMPFTPPDPTCDERRRIVRWIDADAP